MAGVRTGPQSRQGSRWINRLVGPATLAAGVLIPPVAFRTYPAPSSPGLAGGGVLTPDAGDSYTYSSSTGAMDAAALPSNSSGNLRTVFWPTHAFATQNEKTCATWAAESTWQAQQGAALRVNVQRDGAVRAVTVTKNVWVGATWIFNVHVWNSRWKRAFRQIGGGSISSPRSGNRAAWRPSCRGGSACECTERTSTSKSGGSPPPSSIGEIRFTGVPSRSREPRRQTGSPAGTSDISPPVPPPRSPGWARGHGPTLVLRPPRCHRLLSSRDRSTAVDRPPPW